MPQIPAGLIQMYLAHLPAGSGRWQIQKIQEVNTRYQGTKFVRGRTH